MRVIFELLVEANLTALASFAPNLILILACMNVCTRTTGILPGVQFSEYAWPHNYRNTTTSPMLDMADSYRA